jgi:hypothetical protein
MYVDVAKDEAGTSTHWFAESGVVDVFVLLGPTPAHISHQVSIYTYVCARPSLGSPSPWLSLPCLAGIGWEAGLGGWVGGWVGGALSPHGGLGHTCGMPCLAG